MNTILLVDDETVICAELARTLEGFLFRVELAPTVESGLERAQAAKFDAILVEFNIRTGEGVHPRSGNGLKVIHQLRALEVTTPILVFTAMTGELYEAASLDVGADDFIPKTTSIPSLISRLHAHIRRQEMREGNRTELERKTTRRPSWP